MPYSWEKVYSFLELCQGSVNYSENASIAPGDWRPQGSPLHFTRLMDKYLWMFTGIFSQTPNNWPAIPSLDPRLLKLADNYTRSQTSP